tara:strand:- start:5950 stop:6804 length:855 start_codon:yes stop_codon:yes gene_type:complete
MDLEFIADSIFFDLNKSLSTYIPNSDISKINNGDNSVQVDDNFITVFNKSKSIWKHTKGYFDPTAGILANAYGLGPNTVPKYYVNTDSIMNFIGFEKVFLENRSVKISKGMFLDFNAIAKGYCVDLLSKVLKENDIKNHLIEIGGEMYASGINNITNTNWKVGISDPLQPEINKQKIFLNNNALASSGNYRKFLIEPDTGFKIVHTINPNNGRADQTNILATSVIAKNCMTADAYATAFMAMPLEKSINLINTDESLDGMIIYLDVNNEIQTFYSLGFKNSIFN